MMRLAVDFGAHFADLCLTGPAGRRLVKQPLGDDPVAALLAGLDALAVPAGALDEVRIATTRPLNDLLAQEPAPVALLCTEGFGDVLELGRQDRIDLYAPVAQSAAPLFLAAPGQVHEIGGRIGPDGRETQPLDLAALDRIVPALESAGIRSVAIAFLFSHANAAHERAVAERLARDLPGLSISLSHSVDPAPREYERSVGTLVDAWLHCMPSADLSGLARALGDAGFAGTILFGEGRGVVRDRTAAQNDLTAVLVSGPAAAARGALAATGLETGDATGGEDAVVLDLGSRSADLMLLRDGAPVMADPGQIAGIPLRRDLVDVTSLPLGGQTPIAVEDGRLRPGAPDAPTLDMVLQAAGRLPGAASLAPWPDAIRAVAAHLAEETIRFATRRNVDPVQAGLVVCGGAGGLLAADIARAIGLSQVRLPSHPGAAGATGLADAPERAETAQSVNAPLEEVAAATLFRELDAALAEAPDGYRMSIAPRPEMHPMTLTLAKAPATVEEIRAAWHAAYAALYEIAPPGPGHIGRVTAIRDRRPPGADIAGTGAEPVAGPALVETGAGAIWVPEGWRLRIAPGGYVLEDRT